MPVVKALPTKTSVAFCCAFLIVITLLAYSGVRKNQFVHYDDDDYITQNASIRSGPTRAMVLWSLRSTAKSNWHPLTWISHAWDVRWFGMNPAGHHLHSLALHATNAVLLFLLLTYATGFAWRSLAVAVLFALHPLNVESVAWAAERKTVLSMLLFLLAIAAYGWYAKKPRLLRYLLVAVLFALALAAKPMVITLPFVLLLLDWWPLQRIKSWTEPSSHPQSPWPRLVLEKLPLLALSAGSAVITLIAQRGAVNPEPFGIRFGNAVFSYSQYIWKALWPSKLAAFYPMEAVEGWRIVFSLALLVAISTVAWRQRFRRPWLITGWLLYLGALVPVIGLIQVGAQAMADRYMYLPGIGIFVIAVWSADELFERRGTAPHFRFATAALILAILGVLTSRQVGFWHDSIALWTHAVTVTDQNLVAEDSLGDALLRVNKNDEALVHFENAARINPRDPTSQINIAADLQDHGRLDEAIAKYQMVLPWTTDTKLEAIIYNNMGNAYRQLGDLTAAQKAYAEALEIEPQSVETMERLGRLRIEMAIQDLREKISVHPSAAAYAQLGNLQRQLGHVEDARSAYAAALNLDPQTASARQALLQLGPTKP